MCGSGSCHLSYAYCGQLHRDTCSVALSAREPCCAGCTVRGKRPRSWSVLHSGCSWHMIHQGLVPSGADKGLFRYNAFTRNRDLEEYHKAMISLLVRISHAEAGKTKSHAPVCPAHTKYTHTWFSAGGIDLKKYLRLGFFVCFVVVLFCLLLCCC